MKTGSTGFNADRIDALAIPHRDRTPLPVHHDTSTLNGRQAEPWEREVQQRAYEQMRQQNLDLLNIAPRAKP